MEEFYNISPMARTNISKAMDSLRNTAKRLNDPELDLAVTVLEGEICNIPKSFSVCFELKMNGTGIIKTRPPQYYYSGPSISYTSPQSDS